MNEILKASIPAALPTLMVLIGILLNKTDITALRSEMTSLRGEMNREMNSLRGDTNSLRADMNAGFREMRAEFKEVRADMAAMRKQQHDDLINLMKSDQDQDVRITPLEDRS